MLSPSCFPKIVVEIANALGVRPHKGRYRMWNDICYIGDTALVFDCKVRGGYCVIPLEEAGKRISKKYVIEAIKNGAFSLGEYAPNGRVVEWWERSSFPPGFFTGKVGPECSNL